MPEQEYQNTSMRLDKRENKPSLKQTDDVDKDIFLLSTRDYDRTGGLLKMNIVTYDRLKVFSYVCLILSLSLSLWFRVR